MYPCQNATNQDAFGNIQKTSLIFSVIFVPGYHDLIAMGSKIYKTLGLDLNRESFVLRGKNK